MLDLILLFFIYSYIGWVLEVIYCGILDRFTNRGFLYGPICPIYGMGAVILLIIFQKINYTLFSVFILGMIIPSVIEYITSMVLEYVFKQKWWDYSNYPLNINGRVNIINSLYFGILAMIVVYLVNPFILSLISKLSTTTKSIISISLVLFFVVDLIFTSISLISIRINKDSSKYYQTIKTRFRNQIIN